MSLLKKSAIDEARNIRAKKRTDEINSGFNETRPGRYKESLCKVAELAKNIKADKLVVYQIGVGYNGGTQAQEVITDLRKCLPAGRELELHLFDYDKDLLNKAIKSNQSEFPNLSITPHHLDVADVAHEGEHSAHIIIGTNVVRNTESPSKEMIMHNLASWLEHGGLMLLDSHDYAGLNTPLAGYGLKQIHKQIEERSYEAFDPEFGLIFKKVGKVRPFHEVLATAKEAINMRAENINKRIKETSNSGTLRRLINRLWD